jgi:hypothetical protein
MRKRSAGILLVLILVIAIAGYFELASYFAIYPPFCHGSPPGGDCLANYSYDFTLIINYTGPWTATYYGSRSMSADFVSSGSYIQNHFNGTGNYATSVTLSGPNTQGLLLCASATKLDSSTSPLTISIGRSNSTSQPYGTTYICTGVVP